MVKKGEAGLPGRRGGGGGKGGMRPAENFGESFFFLFLIHPLSNTSLT